MVIHPKPFLEHAGFALNITDMFVGVCKVKRHAKVVFYIVLDAAEVIIAWTNVNLKSP